MKSHKMHLIPPAGNYDSTGSVLSTKEAHQRFVWSYTKFPVSHKESTCFSCAIFLYKQFRHCESLLSVLGMVGTILKSECPDTTQGSTLQAGIFKDSDLRPAVLTLFIMIRDLGPINNFVKLVLSILRETNEKILFLGIQTNMERSYLKPQKMCFRTVVASCEFQSTSCIFLSLL